MVNPRFEEHCFEGELATVVRKFTTSFTANPATNGLLSEAVIYSQ